MPHQRTLRRIRAGLYEHLPTGRLIVRSEAIYEGPRGGKRDGWEAGYRDEWGNLVIDDFCLHPTLREAVEDLERSRG
jgi:hypothetical protein